MSAEQEGVFLDQRKQNWEENTRSKALQKTPERPDASLSIGGLEVKPYYFPTGDEIQHYLTRVGPPGELPFTGGIHPGGYRTREWVRRQFAGFGEPADTNDRFKRLIEKGQTGLSTAFDQPTLYGLDADDPDWYYDYGNGGVACSSIEDIKVIYDGIDLSKITTSMTINAPAPVIMAFYIANAKEQGIPMEKLSGTIQNDTFKEFHAQKETIFDPQSSLRLGVDLMEFVAENMPRFYGTSVSGYHIREAGSTAVQELAFTTADGFAYVEALLERGVDINKIARQMSFFLNSHNGLFTEAAKPRALRRIYATVMQDMYHVTDERSLQARIHTQTSGASLKQQEPLNNLTRTAYQQLSAVLGGTQSLHVDSFDEAIGLPTENAAKLSLFQQEILLYETGVTEVADPLAGSYYFEALTDEMERQTYDYHERIIELGESKPGQKSKYLKGVMAGIKNGFFVSEIGNAAYQYQNEIDLKERKIVGENIYVGPDLYPFEPFNQHKLNPNRQVRHAERLVELRKERDNGAVEKVLDELRTTCQSDNNVMPVLIDAAHKRVTLRETMDAMADVFPLYPDSKNIFMQARQRNKK